MRMMRMMTMAMCAAAGTAFGGFENKRDGRGRGEKTPVWRQKLHPSSQMRQSDIEKKKKRRAFYPSPPPGPLQDLGEA